MRIQLIFSYLDWNDYLNIFHSIWHDLAGWGGFFIFQGRNKK